MNNENKDILINLLNQHKELGMVDKTNFGR